MEELIDMQIKKHWVYDDEVCWCCGSIFPKKNRLTYSKKEKFKTSHHAIPKSLHPIKNIELPICQGCHYKINESYLLLKDIKRRKNVS